MCGMTTTTMVSAGGDRWKKLGLFQTDCDKDYECSQGLWCADQHKNQLKNAGFDERKANCGPVGDWNYEVCFDPRILGMKGGAGGGTFILF